MVRFWHRFSRHITAILGVLAILLPWVSPQTAFGQTEDAVYEIDLAALGSVPVTLTGPSDSTSYSFSLPSYWRPQGGTLLRLDLVYAVNTKTGEAPAQLVVELNGLVLHTEHFRDPIATSLRIQVPPEALRLAEQDGSNDLQVALLVQDECKEARLSTLTIGSSSRLRIAYQERPLHLDLALYPRPFYHHRSLEETPARIVLPSDPNVAELKSAAIIAANLGARTGNNLPLEVTLGAELSVTATQQHMLVIGSPERASLLSPFDLPLPLHPRRLSLRSQMPVAVPLTQTFSYTLVVENTSTTTQELSVEDRLSPLAYIETCQGCQQVGPDLLRWNVGTLAPGQVVSTVVQARADELLGIGEQIEHTASLLAATGQVINVDTLSTTVALESDEAVISSPAKGSSFFVLDGQGVPETDGIVQLLVSPWSERRAILVVTGLNDAAVLRAARALAVPGDMLGMHGQFAIVRATRSLPSDATLEATDITLAELGYRDIVIAGPDRIRLRFDIPRGARLAEEVYLAVHLAHGAALNDTPSTLEISLNNLPVNSIGLQAENATDSWTKVPLLKQQIEAGNNQLTLVVSTDWPSCMGEVERARFWTTIYKDSFLHLPYVFGGETIFDLADYPRFLGTRPDLEDVTFLFPDQIMPDEVQGMVQLLSFLGDAIPGGYFDPQVALSDEDAPEQWRGVHLVALGRPTRNPYIPLVNSQLPQPFVPSRDQILQQAGPVIYRLPPGYDLGLVQLLPVPWDETRAMLVVTGTTDEGLSWAFRGLTSRVLSQQMRGNLVVMVNADEMRAADTRRPAADAPLVVSPFGTPTLVPEVIATPSVTPTVVVTPMLTPTVSAAMISPTVTVVGASSDDVPAGAGPSRLMFGVLILGVLVTVIGVGVVLWQRRS